MTWVPSYGQLARQLARRDGAGVEQHGVLAPASRGGGVGTRCCLFNYGREVRLARAVPAAGVFVNDPDFFLKRRPTSTTRRNERRSHFALWCALSSGAADAEHGRGRADGRGGRGLDEPGVDRRAPRTRWCAAGDAREPGRDVGCAEQGFVQRG